MLGICGSDWTETEGVYAKSPLSVSISSPNTLAYRSQPFEEWFGIGASPNSLLHPCSSHFWSEPRLAGGSPYHSADLGHPHCPCKPGSGKVQSLLALGPCQLPLAYLISPFLPREWKDSLKTESAGFSLVFIGKINCHEAETNQLRLSGQMPFFAFFFCLFSNKSMLNCIVIGVEQQVQENNPAANSNEEGGLIPPGRYSEDNRSPGQQLN